MFCWKLMKIYIAPQSCRILQTFVKYGAQTCPSPTPHHTNVCKFSQLCGAMTSLPKIYHFQIWQFFKYLGTISSVVCPCQQLKKKMRKSLERFVWCLVTALRFPCLSVTMASKTVTRSKGLFQKYHNTLRCPSKILHKHCFQFLLGLKPIVAHSGSFLVLVTTEKSVANSYKEREIGREIVKHISKSATLQWPLQ